MIKQVKIRDIEMGTVHGGILLDNGDVICGCCGGIIPSDEIEGKLQDSFEILKVYDAWVDLTDAIIGDD